MYSQMLKDAIDARKDGKELNEIKQFEPEITVNIDAYIPDSYIDDEEQKSAIHKQFQLIRSSEDIDDIGDALIERVRHYHKEIENILALSTIKMYPQRALDDRYHA